MTQIEDRRRRRSDDPVTALHYQLERARWEASLDALVLVDDTGCLLAGVGAWPACEELAAFAPLLAHPNAIATLGVGTRAAALSADVELCAMRVDGAEVLLCGRGRGSAPGSARSGSANVPSIAAEIVAEGGRGAWLARAAAGCMRILGHDRAS